jgi:acetolactate synthase-1/2/3 large subunit
MNVAGYLLDSLLANGIDTVFGLGGGSVEPIHDALYARAGRIRFVLTRHETAAAFMADAYWRYSGKPAALLTTSGAGIFNACNGIAEAFMNRAPLLCIAGAIPQPLAQSSVLQNTSGLGGSPDLAKAFDPLCVFSRVVTNGEDAPAAIRSAIERMQHPRQGPALLVLPKDVQTLPCEETIRVNVRRPPPVSGDLDQVVRVIDRSTAPLVVAGDGVKRQGARGALLELVTRLNLPVATTPLGGDCFPNRHPTTYAPVDCATVAKGYGVEYVDRIVDPSEVDVKLLAAFSRPGVRVVEIVIQKDACPPMLNLLQHAVGEPQSGIFE